MKNFKLLWIYLIFSLVTSPAKGQNYDCIKQFSFFDTITPNCNYLKYNTQGGNVQLEYGSKYFKRLLPEKYSCEIADERVPKYKWDSNEFICLKYGCGSPCWGVWILPLNANDSVRNIMYDLASDPINHLIVYLGEPDYNILIVENLKLKSRQMFEVSHKCGSSFSGYCIDSISVNKNELYYRFSYPNNFDDNKKVTEYRINLK